MSLSFGCLGEHFDLNGHRETSFIQVTENFRQRLEAATNQLRQLATPEAMEAELAQMKESFDAVPDQVAVATRAYSKCYHWCDQVAGLLAERNFLNQLSSMHVFQQLDPLKKLIVLMSEYNNDKLIPCSRVIELRYHIEFLIENLVAYCTQECIAPLIRTNVLNHDGEVRVLSEDEKVRQGRDIGEYLEKIFRPLFERLRAINYAEANRSGVEAELRLLMPRIRKKQRKLNDAIHQNFAQYDLASRESGRIENERIEEQNARFIKLMECAPAGVERPLPPYSRDQLLRLYRGTEVTKKKLYALLEGGLSNNDHLLHLIAKHGDWPERLSLVSYFLARGAFVDYREGEVQTLARAYGVAVRRARENNRTPQIPDMQVMALLEGAKRLFPQAAEQQLSWLSNLKNAIFEIISAKTKVPVASYEQKYGTFVTHLVRQILLSLYFEQVNKRNIQASLFFQDLCCMWDYLATPLQTVQLFFNESHGLNLVELNQLKRELLNVVTNAFREIEYVSVKALRDKMIRSVNLAADLALPTLMSQMQGRGVDSAPHYQKELSSEKANERLRNAEVGAEHDRVAALFAQQREMLRLVEQLGGPEFREKMLAAMQSVLPAVEQQDDQARAPQRPLRLLDAPQPVGIPVVLGNRVPSISDAAGPANDSEAQAEPAALNNDLDHQEKPQDESRRQRAMW